MKIPGVAWIALIGVITPWLSQYFGNFVWTPLVVIALGAIVKAIEVSTTKSELPRGMEPEKKSNPVIRFFFG